MQRVANVTNDIQVNKTCMSISRITDDNSHTDPSFNRQNGYVFRVYRSKRAAARGRPFLSEFEDGIGGAWDGVLRQGGTLYCSSDNDWYDILEDIAHKYKFNLKQSSHAWPRDTIFFSRHGTKFTLNVDAVNDPKSILAACLANRMRIYRTREINKIANNILLSLI